MKRKSNPKGVRRLLIAVVVGLSALSIYWLYVFLTVPHRSVEHWLSLGGSLVTYGLFRLVKPMMT